MGEADARHLLNRTGFGAPPQQVASYAKLSREQAVDRLLAGARSAPVLTPPSLVHEPSFRVRELGEEEKGRPARRVREGRRTARLVAAGDAADTVAAERADDALLASTISFPASRRSSRAS